MSNDLVTITVSRKAAHELTKALPWYERQSFTDKGCTHELREATLAALQTPLPQEQRHA